MRLWSWPFPMPWSICMRVSVCNWRTSESDVEGVVEAVRKVLRAKA